MSETDLLLAVYLARLFCTLYTETECVRPLNCSTLLDLSTAGLVRASPIGAKIGQDCVQYE